MQYVKSIPKNVRAGADCTVKSELIKIITTVLVNSTTVTNQQNSRKLNFFNICFNAFDNYCKYH
ncbi:hypothetical protein IMCC3317_39000 [Kordia antarctica]|uniref:Uncharacterized protein n=1 Tax=Kordia antarctica TaxID=1218801 RepID=A0A7L4ZPV9_9FLAO|nr:hypothetical protein IMCC3317_39000 [Kordia antarctica]